MGIKRKLNRTGGAMRAAENEVSSFFSTTSINGFGFVLLNRVCNIDKFRYPRRIKSSKLLLTKGLWVGIIVTSIVLCTLVINQVHLKNDVETAFLFPPSWQFSTRRILCAGGRTR